MPLTLDNSSTTQINNETSKSFSFTVGSSKPQRGLFVAIGAEKSGSGTPANPSATYNGVSMLPGGTVVGNDATGQRIRARLLYLAAPATGANTLAVSWSSENWFGYIVTRSYYGVDQTTPIYDPVSHVFSITTGAISLAVPSLPGCIVFDILTNGGDGTDNTTETLTVGGGQTEILNAAVGTGRSIYSSFETAVSNSTTMSWTRSGSADNILGAGMSIKPADTGGGGAAVSPSLMF